MTVDVQRVREHLKNFDLDSLFIEELGWDRHTSRLEIPVDGHTYTLRSFAHKRGVQIFECLPDGEGNIPDRQTRQKIEKRVTKTAYEHLIIFLDNEKTTQIWQWVARQPGQPAAYREHPFHPQHQSGDALIQKLRAVTIPLDEEEAIDLTGAVHKLRDAFDRDRVTKRFYDRFKKEHAAFLDFVKGITNQGDKEWYASLMLNRLMFVYFIQKKGFLDGDPDYLQNRLRAVQTRKGKGKFLSFYRYFLLTLFHEGFNKQPEQRDLDADLRNLIGTVPYLNGGLFEVHELEQNYPTINIPDEAFERLFGFFDQYEWHLDTRPLRNDWEINPDVLGYIFEKYINQKQMGAYYTKEDITDYISKNTVIPFLFDAAKKKCAVAFEQGSSLWRLLQDEPDRYIYPAVRKGVIDEEGQVIPLPKEIKKGVQDVKQRDGWNRPAAPEYALPTETWREHVARRQRCLEIREKLRKGEVHEINDLITLNLNIRQFAEDAIAACEGPELLRAFWRAIRQVSVLDPTCGSGAFLFAALNILYSLYEACLDRMQAFVDDLDRSNKRHSPKKFEDFRRTLAEVDRHPNRAYFILKSIIVGNLYGVDIMEEAVEICKLRLFLKLVAQVESVSDLEPLPDVDFNIRPGNTLVGFVLLDDVRTAIEKELSGQKKLGFSDSVEEVRRIEEEAEIVDRAYRKFHEMQTEHGMDAREFAAAKEELRDRLRHLADQLDRYLAREYGVDPDKPKKFAEWQASHQPFHWFAEFFGIMQQGGFDAVLGNPPWKEYASVRRIYQIRDYATERCGNLHGICTERALALRSVPARISFIVQLPFTCSSRMRSVRSVLIAKSHHLHVVPFDDRPGRLFDGLQHCRSVIFLSEARTGSTNCRLLTTRYQRWFTSVRPLLFAQLEFAHSSQAVLYPGLIPKYATDTEASAFSRLCDFSETTIGTIAAPDATDFFIFYQEAAQYWIKATIGLPYYDKDGVVGSPAHGRYVYFDDAPTTAAVCAVLNSSLFYAYFIAFGDCFHVSDRLVRGFPIPGRAAGDKQLKSLGTMLQESLVRNAERKTISTRDGTKITYAEFYVAKSKPIIDEIDRVLAKHYGFTEEELDFIINYDIKYRMGVDDA